MTHISVTVDDDTLMDGDVGEWLHVPPVLERHMKAPDPWSRPLIMAFTDAAVRKRDTTITIATQPNGWTLAVAWRAE